MQLTSKQILKMLKEIDNEAIDVGLHSTCPVTDKKVGLGVKLICLPISTIDYYLSEGDIFFLLTCISQIFVLSLSHDFNL